MAAAADHQQLLSFVYLFVCLLASLSLSLSQANNPS
jgi:hypothetical protein